MRIGICATPLFSLSAHQPHCSLGQGCFWTSAPLLLTRLHFTAPLTSQRAHCAHQRGSINYARAIDSALVRRDASLAVEGRTRWGTPAAYLDAMNDL